MLLIVAAMCAMQVPS